MKHIIRDGLLFVKQAREPAGRYGVSVHIENGVDTDVHVAIWFLTEWGLEI